MFRAAARIAARTLAGTWRAAARISSVPISIDVERPSKRRAYFRSAVSPWAWTSATIFATARSVAASRVRSGARSAFTARLFFASTILSTRHQPRVGNSQFPIPKSQIPTPNSKLTQLRHTEAPRHRVKKSTNHQPPTKSDHNRVERVLHDPLAAGGLEPRNQIAHGALLDNRVDRHPALVAERRDRGPLQRRQQRQHVREVVAADVQHEADTALRFDRRSQQ